MKLVTIESPYAGDIESNVKYARACMRDALLRGEAPLASHLLYTQPGILKDEVLAERAWGIQAGFDWMRRAADAVCVYTDRGISPGMRAAIEYATRNAIPIEYRTIGLDLMREEGIP